MESKKTDESAIEPSTKRPYKAPEIRKLGSVAELTLTGGSQSGGDTPGFITHKNAP